ncbi:MAG: ABC transporter ATP-binding protein [Arenicellales bacterium]
MSFVILFGLMLMGSLLEAAGIGAVPAFVSLIMKPSSLSEYPWIGKWLSGLPDEPSVHIIFWASLLLLGFIILKNLFLIFVFYTQAKIVTSQQVKLSDRMFKSYQSAPYEWILQRSTSELLRNIQNDTTQVLKEVIMPFLNLIMAVTMISVIVIVLIFAAPGSALLGLLVTGVGLYIVVRYFHKHLREAGRTFRHEFKEIIKAVQQGFGALVDARIIGCETYLNKVHKDALLRQASAWRYKLTIMKATPFVIETFAIFGLLVILFILIKTSTSLESVLPTIFLLGVATIRLKQLMGGIAGAINQINAGRAFIPGIVNDLRELADIEKQVNHKKADTKKLGAFKSLKLNDVSYAYPEVDTKAIENISFQVNRGESIAFVGSTGCGKSTLANLILGLLEPTKGSIKANDIDIAQNITAWRTHLGYIQQSIYLIDDTIRANIVLGLVEEEVDDEQLWSALRSSRLEEFIKTLPDGLDTVVGERGVRLSGGQRQRIGIARALYTNPEVLIMDEATSALDNTIEKEVMEAIHNMKQGRTLIMIAHRLSTVKDCDRLFFLMDGAIENRGTYEELKNISEPFRKMVLNEED